MRWARDANLWNRRDHLRSPGDIDRQLEVSSRMIRYAAVLQLDIREGEATGEKIEGSRHVRCEPNDVVSFTGIRRVGLNIGER